MRQQVIPSINTNTTPTVTENVNAGYPIGQHWFNSSNGMEYIHSMDGVWVNISSSSDNNFTDELKEVYGNNLSTGWSFPIGIMMSGDTHVNVSSAEGFIIYNTGSNAHSPIINEILYAGDNDFLIDVLGSDITYLLVDINANLYTQTTFPTPTERRDNLFIGRVVHPNRTSILGVVNTADYETSPMSQIRDMFSPFNLINDGIVPIPDGSNLSFNVTGGKLYGLGINGYVDIKNPNQITIPYKSNVPFFYRTRNGGNSGLTTFITPDWYDNNGTLTQLSSLGGDGNAHRSTNIRVFQFSNGNIVCQYGQKYYDSLALAVANIPTENFVKFSNVDENAILIGIISVRRSATVLNNSSYAIFTSSSMFGEIVSGAGGTSTITLQGVYDNSTEPEIITNPTLKSFTVQVGSGVDTDNVYEGRNTTGTTTFSVSGDGNIKLNVFEDSQDPTGFIPTVAWGLSTVSIVDTTKLQIIINSSNPISYYWRGKKTVLGTSITVTSTEDKSDGIWYCYSIDGIDFILTKTPFYICTIVNGLLRTDLMLYEFYWDDTNDTTLWIQPETHGIMMDASTHYNGHESFGTRYVSGLNMNRTGTLPVTANVDKRFKLSSGELHDEDISVYIVHSLTPTNRYEQNLGSTGTADINYAQLPIYYRSGLDTSLIWRKITTTSYPFYPITNNVSFNYNRLNTGSWDYTGVTSASANNNYWNAWVVGTTNQSEPVVVIAGRISNGTLATVQSEGFYNLYSEGLFTEYKLLYRLIYRNTTVNTTAGRATLIQVDDYRKDALYNNAGVTSNLSASLVVETNYGNVQSAINTLISKNYTQTDSSDISGTTTLITNQVLVLTTVLTSGNTLTITQGTPVVGQLNEWVIMFDTGLSAPSITFTPPSGVTYRWVGGITPIISPNKAYTISWIRKSDSLYNVNLISD